MKRKKLNQFSLGELLLAMWMIGVTVAIAYHSWMVANLAYRIDAMW